MFCQQITALFKVEANHLENKYAREYNNPKQFNNFIESATPEIGVIYMIDLQPCHYIRCLIMTYRNIQEPYINSKVILNASVMTKNL